MSDKFENHLEAETRIKNLIYHCLRDGTTQGFVQKADRLFLPPKGVKKEILEGLEFFRREYGLKVPPYEAV